MKKKLIYSIFAVCGLATATSCSDFLEVSSPSVVDAGFVYNDLQTAQASLAGLRDKWRECTGSYTFGAGAFYALDVPGSDIERHPEATSGQAERHLPEAFWQNGTKTSVTNPNIDAGNYKGTYTYLYSVVMYANNAISAIEHRSDFNDIIGAKAPSNWGFLYGQAIALRAAAYLDLIRYYGDVPYLTVGLTFGGGGVDGLTSRYVIFDGELANLQKVEPLMYRPGEKDGEGNIVKKGVPTRTFVQGLIGRMCVYAGGYSTHRNDMNYVDMAGTKVSFEKLGQDNNNAFYGRRTDYKKFFETAKTYLDAAVTNPGSTVVFHATDPRGATSGGRAYGNPYQYFFQQIMDFAAVEEFADESIYEVPMTRGTSNERPYSSGRVSSGGSSNAYPCKSYGQARIQPLYYYDWFDNNDMRRDVTVTVTGSSGAGVEVLIPFTQGSVASAGGLCMNKFDENRQADPYTKSQRNSGFNAPFMRISDIYLLDAEVNAVLNNDDIAKSLLKKVHERAFASAALAKTDEFITNAGGLYKAIIKERALEFGGEGDRRYVLLRTGLITEAITKTRQVNEAMVAGLENNGYYTFPSGNTISTYIWTVAGDLKGKVGYRLTTQCTDEADPYLFPGWRGQYDDWGKLGAKAVSGNKTNLAIKGLFKTYIPEKVEVKYVIKDKDSKVVSEESEIRTGLTLKELGELQMFSQKVGENTKSVLSITEKDDNLGFVLSRWGIDIISAAVKVDYTTSYFTGYDGTKAPIYLYPINYNTISLSNGTITNGYGFLQTSN